MFGVKSNENENDSLKQNFIVKHSCNEKNIELFKFKLYKTTRDNAMGSVNPNDACGKFHE